MLLNRGKISCVELLHVLKQQMQDQSDSAAQVSTAYGYFKGKRVQVQTLGLVEDRFIRMKGSTGNKMMDGTTTKGLWISKQARWRWQQQQGPHLKSPREQSGGTTEVKVPWCQWPLLQALWRSQTENNGEKP